jgi:hypothetical protein
MNGEDPISQLFFQHRNHRPHHALPGLGGKPHGFIDDKDKVILEEYVDHPERAYRSLGRPRKRFYDYCRGFSNKHFLSHRLLRNH